MNNQSVIMYSTTWCGDCHRAKALLDANEISYVEVNIESHPEAADIVIAQNEGRRRVPTFEINGEFFGNPPITELKTILGLRS
jgi:mycoredoxin